MAITERERRFHISLLSLGRRKNAIPVSLVTESLPSPAPLSEEEKAAKKTAEIASEMRDIIQDAIKPLGPSFPSGVAYKNLIFHDTEQRFDDGHGKAGQIFAIINREGEIRMLRPTRQGDHEEWDLDNAESHPASDMEIIELALPLMTIVEDRLAHRREKSTFEDRKKDLPHDSSQTRILSMRKREVTRAIQKLLLLSEPKTPNR